MPLALTPIPEIPPPHDALHGAFDAPEWSIDPALRASAGGRLVMVRKGRTPALLVLEPGATKARELPAAQFVDASRAALIDVAVHPTRELAALVASDLYGSRVLLVDLETDRVLRRVPFPKAFAAAWTSDDVLVVSGAEGMVALQLSEDDDRWVGTAKQTCDGLWAVAGGTVLVGVQGSTWRVAPVRDGRIGAFRSLKQADFEDHPIVEDRDGAVVVRTSESAWRLDGATDDVDAFDPHALIAKAVTAAEKQAKKSGFGLAPTKALRRVERSPVEAKRPSEVYSEVLDAWPMDDGRIALRTEGDLVVVQANGALVHQKAVPGITAVHPQPGCPTLIWTVERRIDAAKKGVPMSRITGYDLSPGFIRQFNTWEVPVAEPRLHVHADALYVDGDDVLLEMAGFTELLAFYRESWSNG